MYQFEGIIEGYQEVKIGKMTVVQRLHSLRECFLQSVQSDAVLPMHAKSREMP
ncbi:hypothetical protein JV46_12900 [Solemya velum gill symbiont]|uniref:Uncharacterized protein n=1 Tax=Solemya velum gill symbiont TaxID=2340 RepID=A0A0B0H6A5_SOVGS|nr:hypothetical protein JV46_12900 [Solemya velum gill symbiont]